MVATIQKWGNSCGIRIPKAILEEALMGQNDEVNIITEENKLIIVKAKKRGHIMLA